MLLSNTALFTRWLEGQGRTATLDELSRPAIREWLAVLSDTHEPSTVEVRYRGLHRFCTWLVDEGELDGNPMTTLSPPTLTMKPVPLVDDDQLSALLKSCAGREFDDRRDEALIRLMLAWDTTQPTQPTEQPGGVVQPPPPMSAPPPTGPPAHGRSLTASQWRQRSEPSPASMSG